MESSNRSIAFAACVAAVLVACSGAINSAPPRPDGGYIFGDGNFALPPDASAPSACPVGSAAIQREILVPMCGSCHQPGNLQGSLDLVSAGLEARLINRPSSTCAGETLIVPGDPGRSWFFRKMVEQYPRCGLRMPPGYPLDPLRLECLQHWIAMSLPASPTDGGVGSLPDTGTLYVPGNGSTPTCSDRDEGDTMCPGSDCLECHRHGGRADDEVFSVAGTVFPSWDSPVTAGVAGAIVRLREIPSDRVFAEATTNRVGNFFFRQTIRVPFNVEVQRGSTPVRMPLQVETGACNMCHRLPTTSLGPGRIYVVP